MPQAMKYLKLSAASSTNNPNQKAITYLKIADIYFVKTVKDIMYFNRKKLRLISKVANAEGD